MRTCFLPSVHVAALQTLEIVRARPSRKLCRSVRIFLNQVEALCGQRIARRRSMEMSSWSLGGRGESGAEAGDLCYICRAKHMQKENDSMAAASQGGSFLVEKTCRTQAVQRLATGFPDVRSRQRAVAASAQPGPLTLPCRPLRQLTSARHVRSQQLI
eukprot:g8956.t1